MYLRSKMAAFILAAVLSLQVNPSYAHTQSGKLIDLRYDSALGLIIIFLSLNYILDSNLLKESNLKSIS